VFTDHSISTRGPRPLASYFKRKPSARNLGLAYVQMATEHRDATYLEKAWPLLRESAALKLRDPALYSTIANLLNADGHKNEAIAYYRLSLEQDPLQPDALLKLAKLLDPSAEARTLRQKARRIVPVPE
jgi:tetratricopeptide (TPR) repeat protein